MVESTKIEGISVVIPTCGRPSELKVLLDLLKPQLSSFDEVVVTNDGPRPADSHLANSGRTVANLLFVTGPSRGPAANRNFGALQTKCNWILFLDDDVVPDLNLVNAYRNGIKSSSDYDIFEGRTYSDSNFDPLRQEAPLNPNGGNLWSCNFMIKKSAFLELGGFNEAIRTAGGEDIIFRNQAIQFGLNIKFLYDACVYHPPRPLPNVWKIAKRWHGGFAMRVISGSNPISQIYSLPRHILAYSLGNDSQSKGVYGRLRWIARSIIISTLVMLCLPYWIFLDGRRLVRSRKACRIVSRPNERVN